MQAATTASKAPSALQWRLEYAERFAISIVLLISLWVSLHWLPFYGEEWSRALAALMLLAGFFIPRPAMILSTAIVLAPMWYHTPLLALWSLFFLWIMFRLGGRRPGQAIWLVASPILVGTGLGFLPLLIHGAYFRSKMGLGIAAAWLISLVIGLWGGWSRFGLVVLSGIEPSRLTPMELREPPTNLANLAWLGTPMHDLAKEFRPVGLWVESLTASPLYLLQVTLIVCIAILTFEVTRRTHAAMRRTLGTSQEAVAEMVGAEVGALVATIALLASYYGIIPLVMGEDQSNGGVWVVAAASFTVVSAFILGRAVTKEPLFLVIAATHTLKGVRTSAAVAAAAGHQYGGAAAAAARAVLAGAGAYAVAFAGMAHGALAAALRPFPQATGRLASAAARSGGWAVTPAGATLRHGWLLLRASLRPPYRAWVHLLSATAAAPSALIQLERGFLHGTLNLLSVLLRAIAQGTARLTRAAQLPFAAVAWRARPQAEAAVEPHEVPAAASRVEAAIATRAEVEALKAIEARGTAEAIALIDEALEATQPAAASVAAREGVLASTMDSPTEEELYSEASHILGQRPTYADVWALAHWYLRKQHSR